MPSNSTLYETDFYAWVNEQAALLRAGRLTEADVENIAEEMESMGRSERRELANRLALLMIHLLKWRHQVERRGNSWRLTIEEQRVQVGRHLRDNPSLKSQLHEAVQDAYEIARLRATRETGLPRQTFPPSCPFSFDDAMNPDFWPE